MASRITSDGPHSIFKGNLHSHQRCQDSQFPRSCLQEVFHQPGGNSLESLSRLASRTTHSPQKEACFIISKCSSGTIRSCLLDQSWATHVPSPFPFKKLLTSTLLTETSHYLPRHSSTSRLLKRRSLNGHLTTPWNLSKPLNLETARLPQISFLKPSSLSPSPQATDAQS